MKSVFFFLKRTDFQDHLSDFSFTHRVHQCQNVYASISFFILGAKIVSAIAVFFVRVVPCSLIGVFIKIDWAKKHEN